MSTNKTYGLILADKNKSQTPVFQAKRNVFGSDSDSDSESNKKAPLLRPSQNTSRQAKMVQEKAVSEDPTVYQYDEIYESMSNKKEEKKVKNKEDKKPKYIESLLKSANKRKIENERRIERQIQKEREKEGDEFADKEVFVTSAYKKKLEELRIEEEKEKREEYLESIGDVTKQKDLGGFYRHLYEQKLGSDKTEKTEDTKASQMATKEKNKDSSKTRNYRKRKMSSEGTKLSDGELESDDEINRVSLDEINQSKKTKVQEDNIDADSDFSIDESSDEDDNKEKKDTADMFKKPAEVDKENELKVETKPINEKVAEAVTDIKTIQLPPKPKIDIWKKRTVGEVFVEALKRYYERKAARGS